MELENTIVLIVGLVFVSLIAYKVFSVWSRTEKEKHELLYRRDYDQHVKGLEQENERLAYAVANWKSRHKKLKNSYDIEPDDDDDDLIDPDDPAEDRLSDLVKLIYPKLPKSVGRLIDKPELQEIITRAATKNPDALETLLDKFTKKDKAGPSTQKQPQFVGV